jgi:PfpI family intracellular protease
VPDLNGKRVAILATDMFEQVELVEPRKAVEQAGAEVELVSLETGEIQGFNHYDKADTFPVDKAVSDVSAEDYDALLLPGGVGNLDTLRTDDDAVAFVRSFFEQGKPVAAICHAPWTLIEADVRRELGGRGGRRRRGPRHEPPAGRPAGLLRQGDRRVRRRQARRPGGSDRSRGVVASAGGVLRAGDPLTGLREPSRRPRSAGGHPGRQRGTAQWRLSPRPLDVQTPLPAPARG